MNYILWWIKHIFIGTFSIFFLMIGIDTLIASYHSTNPHIFIMLFFSSNLMILISIVGILYPAIKIYGYFKTANEDESNHEV